VSEAAKGPGLPQGIVWIASYPKSGNTWTRAFLHQLFHILEGNEGELTINDIDRYTTWEIGAARYAPYIEGPVATAPRAALAAARMKVQADVAAEVDGLCLIKTHQALVMDRGHPTINLAVTAGAIYVVRNPLDVAVSFAHHMGGEIDDAIDHMLTENVETAPDDSTVYEVYGSWRQHVESWTHAPRRALRVMRYEDMLADPKGAFGALAAHLLTHPAPAQLDLAIARASFERLRAQEDAGGFREKPKAAERFFREGRAGQWRERLSRRQIRRIVIANADLMRRFGYLAPDIAHLARSAGAAVSG